MKSRGIRHEWASESSEKILTGRKDQKDSLF